MGNGAMEKKGEIMTDQKKRILKVEEVGDFWKERTKPRIRLKGKWLMDAGIYPNHHVEVENPQPGVLVINLVENEV